MTFDQWLEENGYVSLDSYICDLVSDNTPEDWINNEIDALYKAYYKAELKEAM